MLRLRAFESLRIVYGTEEAAGGGSAQMINLGQTEPLRLEGGRGAGRGGGGGGGRRAGGCCPCPASCLSSQSPSPRVWEPKAAVSEEFV